MSYLCDQTICSLETSLHSLRRLSSELDGGLQQVDGEFRVWLSRDPAAETIMDTLCGRDLK